MRNVNKHLRVLAMVPKKYQKKVKKDFKEKNEKKL